MNEELRKFLDRKYSYAVVGASNNNSKFGHKIVKTLFETGFEVIPINPKENKVYSIKCYPSLLAANKHIDIVDFVVPANVTLKVLEEIKELGIKKVWFQPGSYDDRCISFCKKNNIDFMKDFCLYAQALKHFD